MSGATRDEAAQEGQDVELTATHAVGNAASSKAQRVETSSRMEDVSVSIKREPEIMGSSDNGSREVVRILRSLGLVPVNFKVAELFCRNSFGDAAVGKGLKRGLVVDCATGWDMEDEKQMKEVE